MAESKVQRVSREKRPTQRYPCPVAGCDGDFIPTRYHGRSVRTIWFCTKCHYMGERNAAV